MTKIDMRDAFFEKLADAARLDKRVIILSADHGAIALKKLEEEMPGSYMNIGISEQNMVGVAAGLASSGKIVFIYGISPFVSLRVLEQLTIDVAAMQLPVNVISVGAGFTYSVDGPTHHGLQDVAAIATIPGITILNSSDPANAKSFVDLAIANQTPHYIRIEKEKLAILNRTENSSEGFKSGISTIRKGSNRVVLISSGRMIHDVLTAAEKLNKVYNLDITIIDIYRLKKFPTDAILPFIKKSEYCISISELYESFFQNMISSIIAQENLNLIYRNIGVFESFQLLGDERKNLLRYLEMDTDSLARRIEKILNLQ